MAKPKVQADVTFLTTEDGGRQTAPNLCHEYRPHIVVQSPEVRQAQVDESGVGCEAYLGVCFTESTTTVSLDTRQNYDGVDVSSAC